MNFEIIKSVWTLKDENQPGSKLQLLVSLRKNQNPIVWNVTRTWWIAVIPDIVIRLMSMSTLTLRSILITASPSLSLMLSWKTISSGNRTRLTPGWVLAKKLALLDMFQECQDLMGGIIYLPGSWERRDYIGQQSTNNWDGEVQSLQSPLTPLHWTGLTDWLVVVSLPVVSGLGLGLGGF